MTGSEVTEMDGFTEGRRIRQALWRMSVAERSFQFLIDICF